jgi:hypothetical protein
MNVRVRPSIAIATLVLVLAACSASGSTAVPSPTASATPTPTTTQVPSPSSSPTPEPSPTPIAYGPTVLVAGIEACSRVDGTATTLPGPTYQHRGDTVACTDTSNDPRVSGDATYTFDWDSWGSIVSGSTVGWGTGKLVNDGGSWVGTYTETYSTRNGDLLMWWWKGEGGYDGLAYVMYAVIPNEDVAWTYPVQGLIYPGEPPTP